MIVPAPGSPSIHVHGPRDVAAKLDRWEAFVRRGGPTPLSYHPAWPEVLRRGLGHTPYWIEAVEGDRTLGLLPLCYVRSLIFGRFLVGMPYLNYGGVVAVDDATARSLIDRAIELADGLGVRRLELRHENEIFHSRLTTRAGHKVHMRRGLPGSADELWKAIGSSVRNQVRKGEKSGLTVVWGGEDRLADFYEVFSQNMRDLGTPVFGRALFRSILRTFPDRSELCVVRLGDRPVAAGLLLHGWGVTEVPSASSLREFNGTCANMLLYWHLLKHATERGQAVFDFGRSSPESSTFRFKKQWGAEPHPAAWQFLQRVGDLDETSRDDPRHSRAIRVWQKLPVSVTRWIGPAIVRGIP
jgi:FemAB-related protein (PEP-CTERM system-associated)